MKKPITCDGCHFYNNSQVICYRLTRLYHKCPCKTCLVKSMCKKPCELLDPLIDEEMKYYREGV